MGLAVMRISLWGRRPGAKLFLQGEPLFFGERPGVEGVLDAQGLRGAYRLRLDSQREGGTCRFLQCWSVRQTKFQLRTKFLDEFMNRLDLFRCRPWHARDAKG